MSGLCSVESCWIELCWREGELHDIAAGSYRSGVPERIVLERKLRAIAAVSYISRGLARTFPERGGCGIQVGSLKGMCWRESCGIYQQEAIEKIVLERELQDIAAGN